MNNGPRENGRIRETVVLVTGGAGGIGRAVCEALAREGARLAVADRDDDGIRDTLSAIRRIRPGADPIGLTTDIADAGSVERMADGVLDRFGRIDSLIAAAGILRGSGRSPKPLAQISLDEYNDVIGINLRGTFLTNRAVLPTMIRQKSGQIINIASTSGRKGRAFDSVYCASKFGVIGLTESLSKEVEHHGIRVQAVLPDAVETPLWRQNGPIPCPPGSLQPDRVAAVILFLLGLPEDISIPSPVLMPVRSGLRRREPGEKAGDALTEDERSGENR